MIFLVGFFLYISSCNFQVKLIILFDIETMAAVGILTDPV